MRVSLEKNGRSLVFGDGLVLTSLEAEPLRFPGDFPGVSRGDMLPLPRWVTVTGYINADSPVMCEYVRRILARITAPDGSFRLNVGDRHAAVSCGELTFHRAAPFSGELAESFTLRGSIAGGFFEGDHTEAPAVQIVAGTHLTGSISGAAVLGTVGGDTVIRVNNRGDVPAPFTAEFTAVSETTEFRFTDTVTGKFVACRRNFSPGDRITVNTMRDGLSFRVHRGEATANLTGIASEGSELFLLPMGETVLTVGTGTAFTGGVSFSERYVTF